MRSSSPTCPQSEVLVALGILSAPDYHIRRMAQRHSWMRWPNVGRFDGAAMCVSFVVRAGGAPRGVAQALKREASVHGDMLLVADIPHNETRVRGPLLSLAWWLIYAGAAMRHAAFIGKVDDDAYLHAPDLERLLRTTSAQLGPSANVYVGVHTWYHWYGSLFANARHAWTFQRAMSAGSWCRGNELRLAGCADGKCGTCAGPFAFAAGYLVVCSRALVDGLLQNGAIASEAGRLRALSPARMIDHRGKATEQVMEDVWLGSMLHRFPLRSPVTYLSLLGDRGARLYVDYWDFRVAPTALLVHVITKQPERYLALHDLMATRGMHCSQPFRLHCARYCATRADGGGHRADASSSLEREHEWCKQPTAGRIADEWCTVQSGLAIDAPEPSSTQSPMPTPRCCALGPNATCKKIIGSNKWPVPFKRDIDLGRLKRFVAVPTSAYHYQWTPAENATNPAWLWLRANGWL